MSEPLYSAPTADDYHRYSRQLKQLLAEALDLAEEGWEYASEYFRDKNDASGRLAEIKAKLEKLHSL